MGRSTRLTGLIVLALAAYTEAKNFIVDTKKSTLPSISNEMRNLKNPDLLNSKQDEVLQPDSTNINQNNQDSKQTNSLPSLQKEEDSQQTNSLPSLQKEEKEEEHSKKRRLSLLIFKISQKLYLKNK